MSTSPLQNRAHVAELVQIARFGFVGVAATLAQALGSLLAARFHVQDWQAILIGFVPGFTVSYLGHRHFTFGRGGRRAFLRFLMVGLTGLLVATSLVPALRAHLGIYARILVGVMAMPVATYFAARFWAFKAEPEES